VSKREDRLPVVIRLREEREREHLVARAQAQRRAAIAQSRVSGLLQAMTDLQPKAGAVLDTNGLQVTRLGALGLADEAVLSERERRAAEVAAEQAERRRQQAAIARRSVERLKQRRDAEVEREEKRRQQQREDEMGLAAWRRSR